MLLRSKDGVMIMSANSRSLLGRPTRSHTSSGQHRAQCTHAARPGRQPSFSRRFRLCHCSKHRLRSHQTRPRRVADFPRISGPTPERFRPRSMRQRSASRQCSDARRCRQWRRERVAQVHQALARFGRHWRCGNAHARRSGRRHEFTSRRGDPGVPRAD
jgi:hypothetical protein